jgi:murein DD-endopeptidase MepM/ murein hydrolase activator NlpD
MTSEIVRIVGRGWRVAAGLGLLVVFGGLVSAAWSAAAVEYALRGIDSPQTPPPFEAELAPEVQDELRGLALGLGEGFARDAAIDQVIAERAQASLDRDQALAERERAFEERDAAIAADRERLIDLHAHTSRTIAGIERMLASTGIDPSRVIRVSDSAERSRPRGGPFVPWSDRALRDGRGEGEQVPRLASLRLASMLWGFERLQALRNVLAHLPLASPLPQIDIFGGFGRRDDPFTGRAALHEGLDLRGTSATPVFATADGTVSFAGWYGDYGNMVEIDHGYGFTTRYAHLGRILVKAGDPVALRQQLGIVGATGRVTALHLHYEVRIDGRARNPVNFLKAGQHVPKADYIVAEEVSFEPDAFAGFHRRRGAFDLGSPLDRSW